MENIAEELGWKPIQVMTLISVNIFMIFIDVELLLAGYRTSGLGVSADFRFPCPGENMMKKVVILPIWECAYLSIV